MQLFYIVIFFQRNQKSVAPEFVCSVYELLQHVVMKKERDEEKEEEEMEYFVSDPKDWSNQQAKDVQSYEVKRLWTYTLLTSPSLPPSLFLPPSLSLSLSLSLSRNIVKYFQSLGCCFFSYL